MTTAAPSPPMNAAPRTWFHGTSIKRGPDEGDRVNPKRGSYEPCVWLTSSMEAARRYADATAALEEDDRAVVFEVTLDDDAVVKSVDDSDDIEAEAAAGCEVLVIQRGEYLVPMAAVLTSTCARFTRVVG